MAILLSDVQLNVQDHLSAMVIDEFRKNNYLLDHLTFEDVVSPAGGGATMHDLQIMVDHARGMKVKAAGGIRTLDDCLEEMAIGVVRCGTRASEAILKEAEERAAKGELYLEIPE